MSAPGLGVWTSNDFEGIWPVPTAAVVIADSEIVARELLIGSLKEHGISRPGDFSLVRLPDKPGVRVLSNGNY